jgi:hypothetical protein
MKKISGIVLKVLAGILLLIVVLLFSVPVLFKGKIKTKVESSINKSLNAKVAFTDYKLGFFRNFPNLSFSLQKLSVTGVGKFEGDTLAAFKSLDLVFNLLSLFSKSGYEVKSIVIDQAVVKAIVLKNGTANWDITKSMPVSPVNMTPSAAAPAPAAVPSSSSESSMKILLRSFVIRNSSVSYSDSSMSLDARLNNLNFILAGRVTLKETFLKMTLNSGETTVIMDGIKYLNKAKIDSKINMLADLKNMRFTMRENYFSINDLKISLSGVVSMPGKNIETDLLFGTDKASFKTIMSLVPAVYMSGYEDLNASGEVTLSGFVKGIYSEADSTMPDVNMNFIVSNGLISYPALPEKISNIGINASVFVDGKVFDRTTLNLEKFHFDLAGSPFDMTFFLKTPVSDPDFKGSMIGKIDLNALSKALPMKGITLSGIIDMSLSLAGKLSMIEKEQYESFTARGTLGIKNMIYSIAGYPRVEIRDAAMEFTPAFTRIKNSGIVVEGTSDFSITGDLENYIPYVLRNKTLKAKLVLHSNQTDVSAIMKGMSSDTTSATTVKDTAGLVIIPVPKNIDFDFNALIEKLSYDNIKAEKVKGHVIAKDGILSFRETGMNILGGTILMNADYDTRDTLKPVMKADFDIRDIGVKDAFNTFNTVKKLAPAAKGIDGKINAKLNYTSLLGSDMMPVTSTINGSGKLQSDQITLVESETFNQMKSILKLGDKYSSTFKDINVSFKISNGRIYVSPFDVKTGNLKMNISGDQGIDQTLNYIVKTEIPRSDLGGSINSFIDNLASQAASFGINFKPSEMLKVNVRVTGTFTKPIVAPFFGNTPGESTGGVKEAGKEAIKQTIDNTVDKAKEKARAEAEAEGERLVKEAEEKGQQLRDAAAKTAEQIRKEADTQGKNLIDEAASKGTIARMAAQQSSETLKKNADKKAEQLVQEADVQAKKLVEEAKVRKEEMIRKI